MEELDALCEELIVDLRRHHDEDTVQETMIKFVEYVRANGLPGLPYHWVRRAARRTRLDMARGARRRDRYEQTARMEIATSTAPTQHARVEAREALHRLQLSPLIDEQLNGTKLGDWQRWSLRQQARALRV